MNTTHEISSLRNESPKLKCLLSVSDLDHIYCGYPRDSMSKCKNGSPGCGRADDMLLAGLLNITENQEIPAVEAQSHV